MIVYYDILLLDDESLLQKRHSERFRLLQSVVRAIPGHAELVPRQIIDFGSRVGASDLRNAFSKTIRDRGEGLVLKPDHPYFAFGPNKPRFSSVCIKLKKEYIGNFGDVGDFAAVGAAYDPIKAKSYGIPNVKWTHFFIGCLNNQEEVKRWNAKPEFTVVNYVELNETCLRSLMQYGNPMPVPRDANTSFRVVLPLLGKDVPLTMGTAFTNPQVFDMRCFSFERSSDCSYQSMRFPSITKIHFDRDFTDTITFDELQEKAKKAVGVPENDDSQENLDWIAKLEAADPGGVAVDAASQLTASTVLTPTRDSTQRTMSTLSPEMLRSPALRKRPLGLIDELPCAITQRPSLTRSHHETRASGRLHPGNLKEFRPPSSSSSNKRRCSSAATPPVSSLAHVGRSPLEPISINSSQRSSQSETSQIRASPGMYVKGRASPGLMKTIEVDEEALAVESQQSTDGPRLEVSASMEIVDECLGYNSWCSHANGDCHLGSTTIFLYCALADSSSKLQELIESHGLKSNIRESGSELLENHTNDESCKIMVLVDHTSRTGMDNSQKYLEQVENARTAKLGRDRDWIDIYDWRVLENVGTMEDESMKKKYYEGFAGPWKRWYVGMI